MHNETALSKNLKKPLQAISSQSINKKNKEKTKNEPPNLTGTNILKITQIDIEPIQLPKEADTVINDNQDADSDTFNSEDSIQTTHKD